MFAQAMLECGLINALPQNILIHFLFMIEKTRRARVLLGTSFYRIQASQETSPARGQQKHVPVVCGGHVLLSRRALVMTAWRQADAHLKSRAAMST